MAGPAGEASPARRETSRGAHSERVRRGMQATAAGGFCMFAIALQGYRKVPELGCGVRRFKLKLDPPAYDVVRCIFDLRREAA